MDARAARGLSRVARRIAWGLAAACGLLLIVVVGLALFVRHAVNDGRVPVADTLLAPGASPVVMAIWAHPDDEITAAGTLARMTRAGAKVTIVWLTHGEAAHHTGYAAAQLYDMRPLEARVSAHVLGADAVVLDYGDGRLPQADAARAEADILRLILQRRPSTVVSFDEQVGFYGHPDHVQAGRWTAQVVREHSHDPGFPVKRLYQATLPAPVIALARRYIKAFRDNYPPDPAKGLPPPTVAVPIAAEASAKRAVLDAHVSQAKVIDDVQPFGRKLPAWLYYRLFDREYFARAL